MKREEIATTMNRAANLISKSTGPLLFLIFLFCVSAAEPIFSSHEQVSAFEFLGRILVIIAVIIFGWRHLREMDAAENDLRNSSVYLQDSEVFDRLIEGEFDT